MKYNITMGVNVKKKIEFWKREGKQWKQIKKCKVN